jgi:hypothetical protein
MTCFHEAPSRVFHSDVAVRGQLYRIQNPKHGSEALRGVLESVVPGQSRTRYIIVVLQQPWRQRLPRWGTGLESWAISQQRRIGKEDLRQYRISDVGYDNNGV